MPTPLKELYSLEFFNECASFIKQVYPEFENKRFISNIFDKEWKQRELKDRMRHTSNTLVDLLPKSINQSLDMLSQLTETLIQNKQEKKALQYMFIPDFIEVFGINHFEKSMQTIEKVTQFTSCEFAVRPFIIKYPETMPQMVKWSKHPNHCVRRLASEGCRPRLPWAMALPDFKNSPKPILPILENLKKDDSEFVRKSVANNLNDISKDNPELALEIAYKWYGKYEKTNWIVKHGCRTLLKQGNEQALALFGLQNNDAIRLKNFKINNSRVKIGSDLTFQFDLKNESGTAAKVRLEYAIYYLRNNGTHSKKVFKISEKDYAPQQTAVINRKQPFKIISTRRFYLGEHFVSLIINGKESGKLAFEVVH